MSNFSNYNFYGTSMSLYWTALVVSLNSSNISSQFFLNWTFFYFAFPQASVAIHRCLPEYLLVVARRKTRNLVNAPICIVAFSAVSYKHSRYKCRSKRIRACFRTRLSGKALTGMPHLLRAGNFFLHPFTLTVHGYNRNWPSGSFIAM